MGWRPYSRRAWESLDKYAFGEIRLDRGLHRLVVTNILSGNSIIGHTPSTGPGFQPLAVDAQDEAIAVVERGSGGCRSVDALPRLAYLMRAISKPHRHPDKILQSGGGREEAVPNRL